MHTREKKQQQQRTHKKNIFSYVDNDTMCV